MTVPQNEIIQGESGQPNSRFQSRMQPAGRIGAQLDNEKPVSYSSRSRSRRSKSKDLPMSTYFPSGAGLAQNVKRLVVGAPGQPAGHLTSQVPQTPPPKRTQYSPQRITIAPPAN